MAVDQPGDHRAGDDATRRVVTKVPSPRAEPARHPAVVGVAERHDVGSRGAEGAMVGGGSTPSEGGGDPQGGKPLVAGGGEPASHLMHEFDVGTSGQPSQGAVGRATVDHDDPRTLRRRQVQFGTHAVDRSIDRADGVEHRHHDTDCHGRAFVTALVHDGGSSSAGSYWPSR